MVTFLKILFFGSSVTITPEPINIGPEPIVLIAPEKLDVVTPGAHIRIDISHIIKAEDLSSARTEVQSYFPDGCVVAEVVGDNTGPVRLDQSGVLWNTDTVLLSLSAEGPIDESMVFSEATLSSCKPIDQVTVQWINYKK